MLHKIVKVKKQEIAQIRGDFSILAAEKVIATLPGCTSMKKNFKNRGRGVGVIAEVKKASPSKGLIREPFLPLDIAQNYEEAMVEGISVLTNRSFFQGNLAYLKQIRQQVTPGIPLLRKDFHIDPIQLYEARLNGADVVLLIAAILEKKQMKELAGIAKDLGMEVLMEVHSAEEIENVLDVVEPDLMGINNRDLRTFTTSVKNTLELIDKIPSQYVKISESGISTADDIALFQEAGVDGVLVGEHFMRQGNVTQAVLDLVGPVKEMEKQNG